MTYIMLSDDMSLTITKMDSIYRGDNLSKKITFLLPTKIGEMDVGSSSVFLSYIRPDMTGDIVALEAEDAMYNADYYQYVLPVTCKISRRAGEVCMWLNLFSGNSTCTSSMKSDDCKIRIRESQNMDDCLSDHQITAIYQMKKMLDSIGNGSGSGGSGSDGEDWEDMNGGSSDSEGGEFWEDM